MPELKAIIDRIEGEKAVLVFNDRQQLIIDKKNINPDSIEGDEIIFSLQASQSSAKDKDLVSNLLKQIMVNSGDEA
jgi:hypothetical protein